MKPTALTPDQIPFNAPGSAACAAARAAAVEMRLPGIPGTFKVDFIGTGTAVVPSETQEVFDVNSPRKTVSMNWYQNRFIGRHWLLGDFTVDMADNFESTGVIEATGNALFGESTVNKNEFYFDFRFKRFPFLDFCNTTPIRNAAVISAVPPIGSVFKLEKPLDGVYEIRTGPNRLTDRENSPQTTIKFNQCDVIVFPERNVSLNLIEQKRLSDDTYSVTVEVGNCTDTSATFAYFTVIHYAGIDMQNDYGFVLLKPSEKQQINYKVKSLSLGRTIDLPFFAALYQPKELNGFKQLDLEFTF